ncbi:MAG: DUF2934 domain-containing protein [Gammaproteobacteria bacterium]|nr:DUF2934 domain-containing protein [Gammaproteobacteria bacterium]MDH3480159.1 DUF2934 domain-containing protein [Gammaproteobacteria bacterium]
MPAGSRSTKSSSKVSKRSARKVAKKAAKKAGKKVAKKAAKKAARKADKKVAKKGAGKTARRPQSSRKKAGKVLSPERRHEMIQTAAYYRAAKRNFQNGDAVADWLSGEKEIDVLLSTADR